MLILVIVCYLLMLFYIAYVAEKKASMPDAFI